jgi:hypothetical protein
MNNIELRNEELEEIAGGLSWDTGFLLGITPLGVLGVAAGAAYWLADGYSDYLKGLDAGIQAANN